MNNLALDEVLSYVYKKDRATCSDFERYLAGNLFYLNPNYQWAVEFTKNSLNESSDFVLSASIQMLYSDSIKGRVSKTVPDNRQS